MITGAGLRLSYALGLLLAPHTMNKLQLAADTRGNGVATMTTRGFGAVHTNLSLLTLDAALSNRNTRVALGLNLACDFGDLVATLLEWRDGDLRRGEVLASVALQSVSMAAFGSVLCSRLVGPDALEDNGFDGAAAADSGRKRL
jgi:predicted outer membrane lipoprotein